MIVELLVEFNFDGCAKVSTLISSICCKWGQGNDRVEEENW
jgi:hypothetical protein